MSENAKDLLIKIGGDVSGFQDTLSGLAGKIAQTIGEINPVAAGIVGAVVGIGTAAVNVAETWEDAFHTLQQETGASGEALEGLKTDWEAVFKSGDEDAATVAKAVGEVARQLDLTGEPLQVVSRNFLDLAGIVGEDVNTVIKSSSQAFNDWKISGDKVAESQDFLLKVNQATGVSIAELTGNLSQAGPTLRQLGLDFEHSATLIGQLSKVGPGASEALAGLGKAVANLTKDGIPAKDALNSIIDGIKNAPNDTAAASDAMEIFGARAGAKLAEQIRAGKFEVDGLTESLKANTTTISDVDNATDGFSAKLGELWNNLQPILVPLGSVLIDAVSELVVGFTELVKWIGSDGAAGAFNGLLAFVQPIIDAFNNYMRPALETVGTLLLGLGVTIVQNALIPALTFLWNNVLVPLGGFLRDVLVGTINGVFGALNSFLDVLSKIPGVSTLVENAHKAINTVLDDGKTKVDDAAKSTTDLKASHAELANTLDTKTHPAVTNVVGALKDKNAVAELAKKATSDLESAESTLADALKKLTVPVIKDVFTAQKDVDDARKKLTDNTKKLQDAEANLKSKLDSTKTSSKDLKSAMDALDTAKKNVKTSSDNLTKAEGDLSVSQKKAKEDADAQKKAFEDFGKELDKINVEVVPDFIVGIQTSNDILNHLKDDIADAKVTADDTAAALKALGVTPKEDLKTLADQASANFKTIQDSGTTSATEVDKAQLAMLNNLKAYYQQSGTDLPAELQTTLTALEGKYNTHKENVSGTNGIFNQLSTSVKQSITDLSTGLVKSLFEDPGSFGKKAMDTLKTLGESVLTAFITPANTAITGFIDGALKKLMSKLFDDDGLLGGLGKVGSKMADIFGSASSGAANAATGAASSGASASSGAASAVSGMAGMVTAIASVGSLISGIIGNFQNAKMETTMNAVEHNTRYSMMYLGERSDGGIIGVLFKTLEEISWGVGVKTIQETRDWVKGPVHDRLLAIKDNTYWSLQKLSNIDSIMTWKVPAQLDQLIAKPMSVSTKVYLDSDEIAARVEQRIEDNIQLQLA